MYVRSQLRGDKGLGLDLPYSNEETGTASLQLISNCYGRPYLIITNLEFLPFY